MGLLGGNDQQLDNIVIQLDNIVMLILGLNF